MVSHHFSKFGGLGYCGTGVIILLLFEEQDSTFSSLNPSLMFISKRHGLKEKKTT